jgi:hypothetical protein
MSRKPAAIRYRGWYYDTYQFLNQDRTWAAEMEAQRSWLLGQVSQGAVVWDECASDRCVLGSGVRMFATQAPSSEKQHLDYRCVTAGIDSGEVNSGRNLFSSRTDRVPGCRVAAGGQILIEERCN